MKILIASDVHGSSFYLKKLIKAFETEKANLLVLLGDVYNHGPRNSLPEEYAPMTVSELLNGIKDKLIVVKGNCDSQVDTLISDFDFIEDMLVISGDKKVLLTHGHVYNKDNLPKTKVDAIIYGHFHTGFIEEQNGIVVANAGSISLPKNNTPNSYIILENGVITLKNLDGQTLKGKTI